MWENEFRRSRIKNIIVSVLIVVVLTALGIGIYFFYLQIPARIKNGKDEVLFQAPAVGGRDGGRVRQHHCNGGGRYV